MIMMVSILKTTVDDLNEKFNHINKTIKAMIINQYNMPNLPQDIYQSFNMQQNYINPRPDQ